MNLNKACTNLTRSTALAACLLCSSGCSEELSPFTSDGCSSFPDGTLETKTLWLSCCTAHDLAYWQGGTFNQRLQADKELRVCVAQTGQEKIAKLMLAGVRVGGSPYLPTAFRWGYGWPYLRGYKPLTEEEQQLVKSQLEHFEQPQNQASDTQIDRSQEQENQ